MKDIIALFDEHGTPTFRHDRETNIFLGVAVIYDLAEEDDIFSICEKSFGLTNSKPLKNRNISLRRADIISEILTTLPIALNVSLIDLSDDEFQNVTNLYHKLGTHIRRIHRGVGDRNIAQILHSQIIGTTLFKLISDYLYSNNEDSRFLIFIDNWSIPDVDIETELNLRSESLREKISDIFTPSYPKLKIEIPVLQRLSADSKRKRFIDVLTSILSRFNFNNKHKKFSETLIQNINNSTNINVSNTTNFEVEFMRQFMDKITRN